MHIINKPHYDKFCFGFFSLLSRSCTRAGKDSVFHLSFPDRLLYQFMESALCENMSGYIFCLHDAPSIKGHPLRLYSLSSLEQYNKRLFTQLYGQDLHPNSITVSKKLNLPSVIEKNYNTYVVCIVEEGKEPFNTFQCVIIYLGLSGCRKGLRTVPLAEALFH